MSESRADCQRVGQTVTVSESWQTVRESSRLSESRADCQRVGQTVRESGRLSESRADCQRVGQTVRESGKLSESQQHCQRSGDVIREAATSSWKQRRCLITMTTSSSGKRRPHHRDVMVLLPSPSRAMILLQCCRIGQNCMPLHGA